MSWRDAQRLCLLQDPSRNHRAYRLAVAKLSPPYIPFMPLLLKGERLDPETSRWRVNSRLSTFFPRHDVHQWGKSKLCGQVGQLWENGKLNSSTSEDFLLFFPHLHQSFSHFCCSYSAWLQEQSRSFEAAEANHTVSCSNYQVQTVVNQVFGAFFSFF